MHQKALSPAAVRRPPATFRGNRDTGHCWPQLSSCELTGVEGRG